MFDLPDAKRVRRRDLDDDQVWSSDGMADWQAELLAQLVERVGRSLQVQWPERPGPTGLATATHAAARPAEEDAYVFRLFRGAGASATVVLGGDDGGGGVRRRPAGYYLAPPAVGRRRAQYEWAAATAAQALESASLPWPGRAAPWRVFAGVMAPVPKQAQAPKADGKAPHRRRRLGQRQRVVANKRERARRAEGEAKATAVAAKATAAAAKRKRLNRTKKLRKRVKTKEMKNADAGGD